MAKPPIQIEIFTSFKKNAKRPAISYENRILLYEEYNQKSNMISSWIIHREIPTESFIGILGNDRIDYICAIIGILKACSAPRRLVFGRRYLQPLFSCP